jgi:hypothetical protein
MIKTGVLSTKTLEFQALVAPSSTVRMWAVKTQAAPSLPTTVTSSLLCHMLLLSLLPFSPSTFHLPLLDLNLSRQEIIYTTIAITYHFQYQTQWGRAQQEFRSQTLCKNQEVTDRWQDANNDRPARVRRQSEEKRCGHPQSTQQSAWSYKPKPPRDKGRASTETHGFECECQGNGTEAFLRLHYACSEQGCQQQCQATSGHGGDGL